MFLGLDEKLFYRVFLPFSFRIVDILIFRLVKFWSLD